MARGDLALEPKTEEKNDFNISKEIYVSVSERFEVRISDGNKN